MAEEKNYSQLTAMFAISRASFRAMMRNPSAVIFSLAFPLIFIFVFGFIKTNRISIEVGINAGSDTTGMVYSLFKNTPNVDRVFNLTAEEMQERLDKGRLDAIVGFTFKNENGTRTEVVSVTTSKASAEKGIFVNSILTNIIDKQNILHYKAIAEHVDEKELNHMQSASPPAEMRQLESAGREYKMIDFILPGQLGFSILSAGVFGTAFVFFSMRQTLVLKRFFATPIRRPYIILGETLSRLVFQLLGSLFIILIGHFVFGFTLIHGWLTVAEMLVLSAFGLLIFMGIGFVISGIAKSENVIPPIANIFTMPQFLLSGTFFPVDSFPAWIRMLSKSLPLTYLNDALRKVAFEGVGFTGITTELLVLVLWGVIIYAAAVRFFRWE
ncbi:MAG: ABC transporter permease [Bacteroidia bacterium]